MIYMPNRKNGLWTALKIWYNELRKDQIIYLNPCKEMTINNAIDITGGNRLVIIANPEDILLKKTNTAY